MTFVSEHLATLHRRRSCTEVEDDTFIEHSAQKKILHRSRRWPRTDVEDHYCFKKLSFFYLEKYPSEISSSFSARSKPSWHHLQWTKWRTRKNQVPFQLSEATKRSFRSYQKSSKRLLNPAQNLEKIHTTKIHRKKWISGDSHFLVWTRVLSYFESSSFFPFLWIFCKGVKDKLTLVDPTV